jgi:hypothetical protein
LTVFLNIKLRIKVSIQGGKDVSNSLQLIKLRIKVSIQGGKDVSNSLQLMQTVDIPTLVEHIQGA